jgi:hypothetical protein
VFSFISKKEIQAAKYLLCGKTCGTCFHLDAKKEGCFQNTNIKYYGCAKEHYKRNRLLSDAACKFHKNYEPFMLMGKVMPRMRGSVRPFSI